MFGSKILSCVFLAAMIVAPAMAFGQTAPAAAPAAPATPELREAPPQTPPPAAPAAGVTAAPTAGSKEVAPDPNSGGQSKGPGGLFGNDQTFLFIMLGALLLMFLLSSRSRKKQEQKKKEQLASMKKGDRVQTIGGIIGTIIEVKPDEIVVKVDEQNNVRMRFVPAAIAQVGEVKKDEAKK